MVRKIDQYRSYKMKIAKKKKRLDLQLKNIFNRSVIGFSGRRSFISAANTNLVMEDNCPVWPGHPVSALKIISTVFFPFFVTYLFLNILKYQSFTWPVSFPEATNKNILKKY